MKQSMKTLLMRSFKLLHMLISTAMFVICAGVWYVPMLGIEKAFAYMAAATFVYLMLILMLGRIYRVYMVGTSRVRQLL